jgi:hypothetical protein
LLVRNAVLFIPSPEAKAKRKKKRRRKENPARGKTRDTHLELLEVQAVAVTSTNGAHLVALDASEEGGMMPEVDVESV